MFEIKQPQIDVILTILSIKIDSTFEIAYIVNPICIFTSAMAVVLSSFEYLAQLTGKTENDSPL